MGAHLIEGKFQSDKYPEAPRGKVPLSCEDVTAQDLLWEYAQRRRQVDAEFSDDLEEALLIAGFARCTCYVGIPALHYAHHVLCALPRALEKACRCRAEERVADKAAPIGPFPVCGRCSRPIMVMLYPPL